MNTNKSLRGFGRWAEYQLKMEYTTTTIYVPQLKDDSHKTDNND